MNSHYWKTLFFLSIFIIFFFGAIYLVFIYKRLTLTNVPPTNNLKSLLEKKREADTLHNQDNYDASIPVYEKILDTNSNKAYESKIKAYLAYDLYIRNLPGDRERSMQIYKSVINDYTIPALSRALLLIDLSYLLVNQDESFIKKNLNQEPFTEYLTKNKEVFEPQFFAQQILEHSDHLYPTSYAKFNIAFALATRVSSGSISGEENIKEAEVKIKEYINEAEKIIKDVSYQPGQLARQLFYKAIGLQSNGRFLGTPSFDIRTEAYKKAIEESLKSDDAQSRFTLGQLRIFYAGFLLKHGENKYIKEIEEQLSLFLNDPGSKSSAIVNYILPFLNQNKKSYVHETLLNLAKTSSDFESYLTQIGWKKN